MRDRTRSGKPKRNEVKGQLQAIKQRFARPSRAKASPDDGLSNPIKILMYLANKELEGAGESTQVMIAEDVFHIEPRHFFPDDNSVVRTTIATLRKQLRDYYAGDGQHSLVKIDVLNGAHGRSYHAAFSYMKPAQRQLSREDETALRRAKMANDLETLDAYEEALLQLNQMKDQYHPPALALRAEIHCSRAMHGMQPKPELEQALFWADRAIQISPDLWQAQIVRGRVSMSLRRWPEARDAFKRAQKSGLARNVPVHPFYTAYLASQGKTGEAIRLMKDAVASAKDYYGSPTMGNPTPRTDLGFLQILGGQLEDARTTLQTTIEDFPDFYLAYIALAICHEAMDAPQLGADVIDRSPCIPVTWGIKAAIHGLAGNELLARSEFDRLLRLKEAGAYVPGLQFAIACLGIRNHTQAMEGLLQMKEDCDPLSDWASHWPLLRHLTYLPEFHDLLKNLGLKKWRWKREN
jgi:tetratricopeptide (TPR) repeat protein